MIISFDTVLSPSTTVAVAQRGIRRLTKRYRILRVTCVVDASDGNPVLFQLKRGTTIANVALLHGPNNMLIAANGGSLSFDVWAGITLQADDYLSLEVSAAAAGVPAANPVSMCVDLEPIPSPGE